MYGTNGMFWGSLEDVGEGSGPASSWSHRSRFLGKQAVGDLYMRPCVSSEAVMDLSV